MAKKYKVWIELEEYDSDTDCFTVVPLEFPATRTLDTEAEALAFVEQLYWIGTTL